MPGPRDTRVHRCHPSSQSENRRSKGLRDPQREGQQGLRIKQELSMEGTEREALRDDPGLLSVLVKVGVEQPPWEVVF